MFRLIICLLSLLVYLVSFGLINIPIVSLTSFNLLNNKFTNRNFNLFSVDCQDLQDKNLHLSFHRRTTFRYSSSFRYQPPSIVASRSFKNLYFDDDSRLSLATMFLWDFYPLNSNAINSLSCIILFLLPSQHLLLLLLAFCIILPLLFRTFLHISSHPSSRMTLLLLIPYFQLLYLLSAILILLLAYLLGIAHL